LLELIERDDPGYVVFHRTVLFYDKRRYLERTSSPASAMDFRAHNLKLRN
jgi:hypothetical protein